LNGAKYSWESVFPPGYLTSTRQGLGVVALGVTLLLMTKRLTEFPLREAITSVAVEGAVALASSGC
ncbi:MAG: hypothetical protein ABEI86_04640, partial [Halobacteriaceae archaeon]